MFASIYTTAMGMFASFLTVLAIPNGDPVITTFTGLAGVIAIFAGCAGIHWRGKE